MEHKSEEEEEGPSLDINPFVAKSGPSWNRLFFPFLLPETKWDTCSQDSIKIHFTEVFDSIDSMQLN